VSLKGKTAIITGSSRGIGREIALILAQHGANIVITGKTISVDTKLDGTIYTVQEEAKAFGNKALAIPLDIRDENAIQNMVNTVVKELGRIDILINNASAISLTSTLDTPLKKFDLMYNVNVRGTFACSKACIPYLKEADNPHILTLSPPININTHWYRDFVAYTISKLGMSLCTIGMSQELQQWRIAVNSLWPQTTIATAAIKNLFPPEVYKASRIPAIVAKAALGILQENSEKVTGQFFIDEEYLRSKGEKDFNQYAVDLDQLLQKDIFLD